MGAPAPLDSALRSSITDLLQQASAGNRRALAKLLSAIENGGDRARAVASLAYRSSKDAYSVGITGAPGAGKSTLVDRLMAVARGTHGAHGTARAARTDRANGPGSTGDRRAEQVAVLAVDPTSPFSGGAILGDRVRMQGHSSDEGVYIRSMASRGHLGGLAVAVPEALRLLAAVGFGLVFVETVGVGQVEVEVASATDTTVVVVNPKWGDSVQASKAGLLEAADIFVVNKADMPGAREARRDLEQMLDLAPPGKWRPPVLEVTASTGEGVEALFEAMWKHHDAMSSSGELELRRRRRLEREMRAVVVARIEQQIQDVWSDGTFGSLAQEVIEGRLDPYEAADKLVAVVEHSSPGA